MKHQEHNEKGSGPPGEYLYHQQLSESQRQRLSDKIRSSHPKPGEHKKLAQNALKANFKTMAIVIACMTALLMLASYISTKVWEIKNEILTAPTKGIEAEPAPDQALLSPPEEPAEGVEETESAPAQKTKLDTETLRKAVSLSKQADQLAEAGKKTEAIQMYREALDIWPYLTDGWAQIGRLYLDLKDFRKAQAALQRAVETDPGSPVLLNDLGIAFLSQNHSAKARDLFTAATEIDPAYTRSYYHLALCHLAQNDGPAAMQALDHYLRLEPDDPRALKEKAYLFASDREYGKALETLKTALAAAPDWPPLYFDAAATAALMGNIEESLRYLDQAEPLTTPSAVYQIYQQPAFAEVRSSEPGQRFEKRMAQRARAKTKQPSPEDVDMDSLPAEPLPSSSPAI